MTLPRCYITFFMSFLTAVVVGEISPSRVQAMQEAYEHGQLWDCRAAPPDGFLKDSYYVAESRSPGAPFRQECRLRVRLDYPRPELSVPGQISTTPRGIFFDFKEEIRAADVVFAEWFSPQAMANYLYTEWRSAHPDADVHRVSSSWDSRGIYFETWLADEMRVVWGQYATAHAMRSYFNQHLESLEIAELIIDAGADLAPIQQRVEEGMTHWRTRLDHVRRLYRECVMPHFYAAFLLSHDTLDDEQSGRRLLEMGIARTCFTEPSVISLLSSPAFSPAPTDGFGDFEVSQPPTASEQAENRDCSQADWYLGITPLWVRTERYGRPAAFGRYLRQRWAAASMWPVPDSEGFSEFGSLRRDDIINGFISRVEENYRLRSYSARWQRHQQFVTGLVDAGHCAQAEQQAVLFTQVAEVLRRGWDVCIPQASMAAQNRYVSEGNALARQHLDGMDDDAEAALYRRLRHIGANPIESSGGRLALDSCLSPMRDAIWQMGH